jgi:PAS domain-containing protein
MLETLIIIGKVAGIITALIGAIFAIYKLYHTIIKKSISRISAYLVKIDKIYDAIGPNGGTSLYDKVVAIDRKVSISDARTQSLHSALGLAEWFADINGQTTAINDIACRLTSRPETDFLGNNWINIIHPDDRDQVVEEWFEAVKDRRSFIMKYRWLDNNNKSLTINAVARPFYDAQKKLMGYIGTVTVINAQS